MLINLKYLKEKYSLALTGIIHCGAHLAEEAQVYTECGVTDVIWIEGNDFLATKCEEIVAKYSNHKVYTAIVSDTDGKSDFHIMTDDQCSSLLPLGKHAQYYPHIQEATVTKVKTTRLDTFYMQNNINTSKYNLLNLDLEGGELMALKGLGDNIKEFDYIYTEVCLTNLHTGGPLVTDLDEYLKPYGFIRVEMKLTDKEWGDAFYIKKKNHTQIVIHVMPYELKELERVLEQLRLSSNYLDPYDKISLYVTLNLSKELIDWSKSSADIHTIRDHFFGLQKNYAQWYHHNTFVIEEDGTILGTTAQKRKAIRTAGPGIDNFIFLDCDIYFSEVTLKYLIDGAKNMVDPFYVITPQTVKLWDETWDCITHDNFRKLNYGFFKTFDPTNAVSQDVEEVELHETTAYKFACGWHVLYSARLLKLIDIPDSLGHYGPEDTFAMFCCNILKQSDVAKPIEYMLHGLYVAEDYILKPTVYKDKLVLIDKKLEFRKMAESHFNEELQNFQKRMIELKGKNIPL